MKLSNRKIFFIFIIIAIIITSIIDYLDYGVHIQKRILSLWYNHYTCEEMNKLEGGWKTKCELNDKCISRMFGSQLPSGTWAEGYECVNKSEMNPAKNIISSCKRSEECVTPGKYLLRSDHPGYTSLCIENTCTVAYPRILDSSEDPNHPSENIPYNSPQVQCNSNTECSHSCSSKSGYSSSGACVDKNCYCLVE